MATSEDTTNVNLQHDITVNGKKYQAGSNVVVPKAQAEDIARIDYEATQSDLNLVKSRKFVGQAPNQDPRV